MAYLFGIALLILLFVVLHLFTEITLKQKIGAVFIVALLISGAYWFNLSSEKRRIHLEEVLLNYTQGKNISCNGIDVNNSVFSYSSGTQTFIGLKNTTMYGRIISLDQCQ